jgi:hypothetical protein
MRAALYSACLSTGISVFLESFFVFFEITGVNTEQGGLR